MLNIIMAKCQFTNTSLGFHIRSECTVELKKFAMEIRKLVSHTLKS